MSWDFSDGTDYTYDSSKIEFVEGKAQLTAIDQIHQGDDFDNGSHVGTNVSNSKLALLNKPESSALHVNSLLPSKSSSLVGYWRFDGDFNDSSSNNLVTTPVGPMALTSFSKIGEGAGDFSNAFIGDYLDISYTGTWGKMTISAWVYVSLSTSSYDTLIASNDFRLQRNSSTGNRMGMDFNSAGGSGDGVTPSAQNQWHHYLVTYDGTNVYYYLNGNLEATVPKNGNINITSLRFGEDGVSGLGGADPWEGYIDELAIWSDDLSAAQVQTLYESQNNSTTEMSSTWTPHWESIVGYWKMDGNWQDSSGNGNHGSPVGIAEHLASPQIGTQAGSFDGNLGNLSHMTIPNSSTLENVQESSYSLSLWVNPNSLPPANSTDDDRYGLIMKSGFHKGLKFDDLGRFRMAHWQSDNSEVQAQSQAHPINQYLFVVGVVDYQSNKVRIYVNGTLEDEVAFDGSVREYSTSRWRVALEAPGGVNRGPADALIDDVAIWNTSLSSEEVLQIYNRQKQKYAGHYDSPVIDLGATGSWTNLNALSSLPFGKEIVSQSTESSLDYTALSGDLSDGLVGLWHFSEESWSGAGGEIKDSSGNGYDGFRNSGTTTTAQSGGIIGRYANINAATDVRTGNTVVSNPLSDLSVSLWVKLGDFSANTLRAFIFNRASGVGRFWLTANRNGEFQINSYFQPACDVYTSSDDTFLDSKWHHVVLSFDRDGDQTIYVDGMNQGSDDISGCSTDPWHVTSAFHIARNLNAISFDNFHGGIDEFAFWERLLTPTEIQQLYRRGANRIKYQVKSCVDSSCECKSFNSAPVGNADDCDGDGTANSLDFDDIYKAEFVGPGGSGMTAFSELFNRDSGNMTFTCNTNTTDSDNDICVDDEITLTGDSSALPPSFSFANFPSSSRPIDNRYFQYRVIMEAEENTACGGEACLPELTSVEVGPTGRFYAGSPSVVNKTSESLDKALDNLQVSNSSGCNMSYQISNDGNNFYYWDETSWVTGSQVAESNVLTTLNSNIGTFTEQVGLGDFYFRSYLGNSNFGECELDELQFTKSSD